jgi:hypothetical protein
MTRKLTVFPLIVTVAAVFAVYGFSKDTIVESAWASAPVKIDGLEQDWKDATFLTDGNSKAQYAVKNDTKNLYLLFVFPNEYSSTTIDLTGMKIFFNAEGKKSKDLGILFKKKAVNADALIASLEKRGEVVTEERKAELRKQKAYVIFAEDLINEKKMTAPSDPAVQTEPPAYRASNNKRVLVYEFRIPLSRINQSGGIGTEPGKTIKIGFEWGGMTKEIMRDVMAGRASSGSRASDRGVSSDSGFRDTSEEGGGRGGGVGGGGAPEFSRDPRYKTHSFWIDLKLAAQ